MNTRRHYSRALVHEVKNRVSSIMVPGAGTCSRKADKEGEKIRLVGLCWELEGRAEEGIIEAKFPGKLACIFWFHF